MHPAYPSYDFLGIDGFLCAGVLILLSLELFLLEYFDHDDDLVDFV